MNVNNIHFFGADKVIEALEKFKSSLWALWQGRQVVVTGDSLDELEHWLESFTDAGSTALYTIRLYDVSPPYLWVTPYLCSFNFKLVDTTDGRGIAGYGGRLAERVAALEKGGEQEEPESLGDVIMGWLKDPEQLDIVAGAIQRIFGRMPPGSPTNFLPMQQQTIGSTQPIATTEDRLRRLSGAIDVLEQRDPHLVEHLEKLSRLDNATFSLILQKLNAL